MRDRVVELAVVGEAAGEHDAALGDERGRRRRVGELVPQLVDLAVTALRPPAVHEHGVLLDRSGEVGERAELLGRGRVLAEPVVHEAEQLAHRGRVGIRVAQRAQQARRVALLSGGVRLGGLASWS